MYVRTLDTYVRTCFRCLSCFVEDDSAMKAMDACTAGRVNLNQKSVRVKFKVGPDEL